MHNMKSTMELVGKKQFVLLVLILLPVNLFSFEYQCPSPPQWKIRAKTVCGVTAFYSCLFDVNNKTYVEQCSDDHDFVRPGHKYAIIGHRSDIECSIGRYQPMKFWSNDSSQCAYIQSNCNGIGQEINETISKRHDAYCTCSHSSGYAFVSKTNNIEYCIPSEEDCTCYLKACQANCTLLSNFECVSQGNISSVKDRDKMKMCTKQTLDNSTTDKIIVFYPKYRKLLITSIIILILLYLLVCICFVILKIPCQTRNMWAENNVLTNEVYEENEKHDEMSICKNETLFARSKHKLVFKEVDHSNIDDSVHFMTDCLDDHPDTNTHLLRNDVKQHDKKSTCTYDITGKQNISKMLKESKRVDLLSDDKLLQSSKCGHTVDLAHFSENKQYSLKKIDLANKNESANGNADYLDKHSDNNTDLLPYDVEIQDNKSTCTYLANEKHNIIQMFKESQQDDFHLIDKLSKSPKYIQTGDLALLTEEKQHSDDKLLGSPKAKSRLCWAEKDKQSTIDQADKNGLTPFMAACLNQHFEIASGLLYEGADINKCNAEGQTVLWLACNKNKIDVVDFLIKNACNIHKNDNRNWSPLKAAACSGNTEICKALISHGALIDNPDIEGWTPLMSASRQGYTETVKLLIESGAEIDRVNNIGKTALHLASISGSLDIVKELLRNGSDPNKEDNDFWTPLKDACYNGKTDIIEVLVFNNGDINKTDKNGWSPLMAACYKGHPETVDCLIMRGANIRLKNKSGKSAFLMACMGTNIFIVECLYKKGIDIDEADDSGTTPLNTASSFGHIDICEYLIVKGANIEKSDKDGMTPILMACSRGHTKVVDLLLKVGSDPSTCNNKGQNGFWLASEKGHSQIVTLLSNHINNFEKTLVQTFN